MKDIFDIDDMDGIQPIDDSPLEEDYHSDGTIGLEGLDISAHTESDFDLSESELNQLNQQAENVPLEDDEHLQRKEISFGSSCVTACSNTCIGGCSGSCSGTCSGNCYGSCNGYCSG